MRARTRLSCSLGVATSKVVAKVASDRRKPGGLTAVRPGREAAFLAPFPIRLLPGVGPRAEERLVAAGIETIGELAALDDEELRVHFRGVVGRQLRDRARGIDPRPLEVSTERISISQRGDVRAATSPTSSGCTTSCAGSPRALAELPARRAARSRGR